MKLVDILARELTEWPINATHAVVTETKARSSNVLGVYFTQSGPPVWVRDHWTIIGSGCGEDVYWMIANDIQNTFGLSQSEKNIASKSEWQSARAAYLAGIQPARDPEISVVVDKPANPWRRNRGRKTLPVPVGVIVDYKLRGDATCYSDLAEELTWHIDGDAGDIMQWRYAEPQQVQGKQMAQTIEQVIENAEAAAAAAFNPIALRDEFKRITAKGAELSQKMAKLNERMEEIEAALRAEGFALVAIGQSNR